MPSSPTRRLNFGYILADVGYQHSREILSGSHWEYWVGSYSTPGEIRKECILYLAPACGWGDLDSAVVDIRRNDRKSRYYVVIGNEDRRFGNDIDRIKRVTGVSRIYSTSLFLLNAVRRAITRHQEIDPVRNFVQQSVLLNDRQPSLEALFRWLRGDAAEGPDVAVLLAPAASGKTSLAKELFRHLARQGAEARMPLLIEREVWRNLVHRGNIELMDVWRESMSYWYPGTILGYDQLERCLAVGAIRPIFDGLDELCTAFPLDINPEDTVRSLLTLFDRAAGGGRLLITSRTSFWTENISRGTQARVLQVDLCPFDDAQMRYFLRKRFGDNRSAEDRAARVLGRIGSATHGASGIEYVPYVVVLAAESADTEKAETLAKYGDMLEEADPIRGLLLAICERERERQGFTLTAEEQVEVFRWVVAECLENEITPEELELCCEVLGHSEEAARKIRSHWFLSFSHGSYTFQYPFIAEYLMADVFCQWLDGRGERSRPDAILSFCAKQPGSLLDQIATLVDATVHGDCFEACRIRYWDLSSDNDEAFAGFVHCVLAVAKKILKGTRRDPVKGLVKVFGNHEGALEGLYITGSISNLDLSGIVFDGCVFDEVEFNHCRFDGGSIFRKCEFKRGLRNERSSGFAEIQILDPGWISPAAQATLYDVNSVGAHKRIDGLAVSDALRDVLRWFMRGPGFKTKKEHDIQSVARRWGKFGGEVVDKMKKQGVLGEFSTSGERMLKVDDRDSVRLFLENRLVVGALKDVRDYLVEKYSGEQVRPRR